MGNKIYIDQYKSLAPISLPELLDEHKKDIFSKMHCVKVGKIESFDSVNQTASIQISYKKVMYRDYQNKAVYGAYPLLIMCPVFCYTGGESYITMPVSVGDNCLIFFADRDIDNWFFNGEQQVPNTYRMHDINDGFALVGFRNNLTKITDYLVNGIRFKFNETCYSNMKQDIIDTLVELWQLTGDMKIIGNLEVTGDIDVGGNILATGSISAGADITANANTTPISMLTHVHTGVTTGVSNTGTAV